jgi:NAD(P)-dependent dehydrogenase (short-subunit alcohol dehydrogenase family)
MNPTPAALRGRHAVVTGGGRGIGATIARALVEQGAAVTLMGRNAATLEDEAARLRPLGKVHCQAVDIADAESTTAAFAAAAQALGPVTLLINNAGQAVSAPIGKTDLALWNRMLAVNLTGSYLAIHAVLPGMLEQGWGRIVNIASTAALKGYPYVSAYCAAKHGVLGLTRALALELAKKPVTVNAVCPAIPRPTSCATASPTSAPRPAAARPRRSRSWSSIIRRAAWCSPPKSPTPCSGCACRAVNRLPARPFPSPAAKQPRNPT